MWLCKTFLHRSFPTKGVSSSDAGIVIDGVCQVSCGPIRAFLKFAESGKRKSAGISLLNLPCLMLVRALIAGVMPPFFRMTENR